MFVPVPDEEADGEAKRELRQVGIEEDSIMIELKAIDMIVNDDYKTKVYLKSEADKVIAELKAENERLKGCEIWMKQHFFCEEVIACESAKNRKLKRALWLARALSANHAANICYYIAHYGKLNKVKKIYQDQDKWDKVEEICIKKAKEYK